MDERIFIEHTPKQLVISRVGVYVSIHNPDTISLDEAQAFVNQIKLMLSPDNIGATVKELVVRPDENELFVVLNTYAPFSSDGKQKDTHIKKAEERIRQIFNRSIDNGTIVDYTLYDSHHYEPVM